MKKLANSTECIKVKKRLGGFLMSADKEAPQRSTLLPAIINKDIVLLFCPPKPKEKSE